LRRRQRRKDNGDWRGDRRKVAQGKAKNWCDVIKRLRIAILRPIAGYSNGIESLQYALLFLDISEAPVDCGLVPFPIYKQAMLDTAITYDLYASEIHCTG
jgi:hypothetical protein